MESQNDGIAEPMNALGKSFSLYTLFKFALPSMVMLVFNGLYTVVDGMFVSRFVGTDALSALNIISPFFGLIWGFGSMIASGGSALIGRKMGANHTDSARHNFTMLALLCFCVGLLFSIIGLLFMDPIIMLLGADDTLILYCEDYFFIILLFLPLCMLQVVFQTFFVAAGRPSLGMNLMFAAGIFNIVFDYVFVALLNMGVTGAALATGIGFMIPSIAGLLFFAYNRSTALYFQKPKLRLQELGQCLFNGSSEMVGNLSISITTFLFNVTMMRIAGVDGVAAITIIIYAQYMLQTVYMGFSFGVAPVFSFNYGSKNDKELKKVFRYCLLIITILTGITFTVCLLFSEPLVGLFASKSTGVFDMANEGLQLFAVSFLFCGYGYFASSLFTALSNGKVSAIISFLRTFLFITVALLTLPHLIGLTGVWISVPLAEFLSGIVCAAFIIRYRKQYHYI